METLYDNDDSDVGVQEGDSWQGGFPPELMADLAKVGFDDPENDLGDDGLKGFANLHGDWGENFVGNIKAIRETLALLPPEIQSKYQKKPHLLNSPGFLKDVAKTLQQYQVEKEDRAERAKDSLKFGGMAEVQRRQDLRAMQDRVIHLLFEHDTRMAGEALRGG